MRVAWVFVCVAVALFSARPARAANPRAEAAAVEAIKKAEGDFLAMNYASGAARLDKALRGCAPANCSAATQAALLRDIGTMEFRAGDRGFAAKAFAEALRLQPTIDLNASYDSPDLRAAWAEIKGGPPPPASPPAAAPPAVPGNAAEPAVPPPPTFPQPTGDFIHTPAAEQRVDTPLPIYIEGGPPGVTHVVVRYKSPAQGDDKEWSHTDLARVGNGWGGTLPCNAITAGTVRYFIQAYNKDMDPVGANGDAKNPYQVPAREALHGSPAHLPGRAAPRACHVAGARPRQEASPPPTAPERGAEAQAAECPPGTTGCGKTETGERESEEEPAAKNGRKPPRIWLGVSFALDLMSVPSGDNLCLLHQASTDPLRGQPLNDKFIYCTDSNGNDFPPRNTMGPTVNQNLHDLQPRAQAGHSDGGEVLGTMHISVAADFAVMDNLLAGARAGYTLGAYPAQAASLDGHASRIPQLYLEGRATLVIGKRPFTHDGLAPIVFAGAGYGEFDGHVSNTAVLPPNSLPGICSAQGRCAVDLWVTSGPFFGVVGGGVRYTAPGLHWVMSGAVRANLALNGAGVIPSFGPDLSVEYGL